MNSKKSFLIVSAVLAVALIAGGVYAINRPSKQEAAPTSRPKQTPGKINLAPATAADSKQADLNKEQIVQKDAAAKTSPNPPANDGTFVIVEATSSNVRAYVQGIFEEGGTCTATAVSGTQTVTASSQGFQNVSYTQCAPIKWPTPLTKGSYTLTLTYKSDAHSANTTKQINIE